ncbi:MAG: hypothetical protein ACRD5D_10430 [Candidatus Polarisedimenticolia bacterium]
MRITRRVAARLALGAPFLAAAAQPLLSWLGLAGARAAEQAAAAGETPSPDDGGPTPLARFLARQEEGLSAEERRRVRRDVTSLERSLKTIRDFTVTNDVPPSGGFRALRSRR